MGDGEMDYSDSGPANFPYPESHASSLHAFKIGVFSINFNTALSYTPELPSLFPSGSPITFLQFWSLPCVLHARI